MSWLADAVNVLQQEADLAEDALASGDTNHLKEALQSLLDAARGVVDNWSNC